MGGITVFKTPGDQLNLTLRSSILIKIKYFFGYIYYKTDLILLAIVGTKLI